MERRSTRGFTKTGSTGITTLLVLIAAVAVAGCQGQEEEVEPADPMDRHISELSAELELNAEQQERLARVRDIAIEHRESMMAEREERFPELVAAIEAGDIDEVEVQGRIDEKLEEARGVLHRVSSELVALVNSMDESQRSRLARRLEEMHERIQMFHDRFDGEGGRHRFMARCLADRGIELPPWLHHDSPPDAR